jgi:hypothetical protein
VEEEEEDDDDQDQDRTRSVKQKIGFPPLSLSTSRGGKCFGSN